MCFRRSWRSQGDVDCNATPIRGPDTVPDFDLANDVGGCFLEKQSQNNCYNYGTDILTNTFAQPGVGSSTLRYGGITCESISMRAVSDGLIPLNTTETPTDVPEVGHYVSLWSSPWDYHWARRDSNGMWSHKPGMSPVKTVDNAGMPMKNPATASMRPYTEMCGYFIAVPSKMTIR